MLCIDHVHLRNSHLQTGSPNFRSRTRTAKSLFLQKFCQQNYLRLREHPMRVPGSLKFDSNMPNETEDLSILKYQYLVLNLQEKTVCITLAVSYLHRAKWLTGLSSILWHILSLLGKMFPSQGNLYLAPFMDDALYMEHYSKANFW